MRIRTIKAFLILLWTVASPTSAPAKSNRCTPPAKRSICSNENNNYADLNQIAHFTTNEVEISAANYSGVPVSAASVTSPPPNVTPIEINLNPKETHQEMWGFGASITESCLANMDKLSSRERDALMKKIFSPKDGAGFSYLRVPLGANDYSHGDYSLDDTPDNRPDPGMKHFNSQRLEKFIRFVKDAKKYNPNLRVMTSPWTPPAWMKDSESLRGGRVKKEYFQAYADYLVKSLDTFKRAGVPVQNMTVMNEPLTWESREKWYFPQGYMPAEDQKIFIRDYLGPALKKHSSSTKILLHDHNWDNAKDVFPLFNDKKIQQVTSGFAYHCYGGDIADIYSSIAKQKGGAAFNTECSSTHKDSEAGTFQWWLVNQSLDSSRAGTSGALGWNLCLDQDGGPKNEGGCDTCRGLITVNNSSRAITFNPEFKALAQVSRFVQPGARRIGSNDTYKQGLVNVAFENADGSRVIAVRNDQDKPMAFSVSLDGCSEPKTYLILPSGVITLRQKSSGGL